MKKRFIALTVLFAVLITLTPQPTLTAYAAATSEVEKARTKLNTAWEQRISTLTGWDKSHQRTLKNEWDKNGWNNWHMPGGKSTFQEELAKDSIMIRSGVEVPRPCNLWELVGFPFYSVGLDYMQGVKIKSNWNVYLNGIGSDYTMYSVSIKSNILKITSNDTVGESYAKCKWQLIKPTYGLDCYVGSDGLAYVDTYSFDKDKFVKNTVALSSNTVDMTTDKELTFTLDLSDMSDGVYCIKERAWDDVGHIEGLYWYDLVVVVSDGKASLQATDISYDVLPKAPEGRVSYGRWWADARSCSEGIAICKRFY